MVCPGHEEPTWLGVDLRRAEDPARPAGVEDEDPVADAEQLVQVLRDEQDRHPRGRRGTGPARARPGRSRGPGRGSGSRRRAATGFRASSRAMSTRCRFPPERSPARAVQRRRGLDERGHEGRTGRRPSSRGRSGIQPPAAPVRPVAAQDEVLSDAQARDRAHAAAGPRARRRRPARAPPAATPPAACRGPGPAPATAAEAPAPGRRGTPGRCRRPRHAQNLARRTSEVESVEPGPPVVGPAAHAHEGSAGVARASAPAPARRYAGPRHPDRPPASPTSSDASRSWVAPAAGSASPPAPPQHRDPVGAAEHLVHLVGDEHHRVALGSQPVEDGEERLGLVRAPGRWSARRRSRIRAPVRSTLTISTFWRVPKGSSRTRARRVDVEAVRVAHLADPAQERVALEPPLVEEQGHVLPDLERGDEREGSGTPSRCRGRGRRAGREPHRPPPTGSRQRWVVYPYSIFMRVLLPAPFSPRTACTSPERILEIHAVVGPERPEHLGQPPRLEEELAAGPGGAGHGSAGSTAVPGGPTPCVSSSCACRPPFAAGCRRARSGAPPSIHGAFRSRYPRGFAGIRSTRRDDRCPCSAGWRSPP